MFILFIYASLLSVNYSPNIPSGFLEYFGLKLCNEFKAGFLENDEAVFDLLLFCTVVFKLWENN